MSAYCPEKRDYGGNLMRCEAKGARGECLPLLMPVLHFYQVDPNMGLQYAYLLMRGAAATTVGTATATALGSAAASTSNTVGTTASTALRTAAASERS